MAQADYIISNQTFPNTRADINNHLSAIATNNSGTSAPTTQYAGQFWIDTTSSTWTLYIHDGSDDIQFATIDTSANTVNFIDSALASDVVINTSGAITTTGAFTSVGIDDNATSTAITIDSSENVGIGTASPSQALDVVGSIEVSDGIYIGGTGSANKLDDYEEGTFTPTVTGSTSGSFTTGDSATKGSYVKIGNQVTVKGEIHITGSSSPVGSLTVGNLPFANAFLTELSERTTGSCWLKYIDLESGARNVTPFITQGNSSFVFYETNDNANATVINSAEVTVPGAEFAFSLTYQTS